MRSKSNEIALWSAVAAFFGYLLAVGIFDVLEPQAWVEYLGAILVAGITGGAVYAKERLGFAKARDNGKPEPEPQTPQAPPPRRRKT